MGAAESRPAPKSDDSVIGTVIKYAAMGAVGAVAFKAILDKVREEENSNGCGGSRPNYPSYPSSNINGYSRGSNVPHNQYTPALGNRSSMPPSNTGSYSNRSTLERSVQSPSSYARSSMPPSNTGSYSTRSTLERSVQSPSSFATSSMPPSNTGSYSTRSTLERSVQSPSSFATSSMPPSNTGSYSTRSTLERSVQSPSSFATSSMPPSNTGSYSTRSTLERSVQSPSSFATKIKACEDQIKRFENVISCYQGEHAEIQIITGESKKWIDHKKVLTDNHIEYMVNPHLTDLSALTPPSDEGINKFMQQQMNADCLDKIFWARTTSNQSNALKVILNELKRVHPNEPESELRKGVILAYNKHKWGILPNQTKKYKKRSQELFLLEKQRVELLCSSFNLALSNDHPLDNFMLWKNFQLTLEKIFWEEATPEKKLLLDQLMIKLRRVHPNVPELKLRQAVVKVFNKHKGGVRPREYNRTLKLVGKLLNSERKDDQSNDDQSEDVCSICLSEFDARTVVLQCTHKFHRECISTWIEEDKSCPNCRHPCFTVPNVTPIPSSSGASVVQSSHVSTGAIPRQRGSQMVSSSTSYASSSRPVHTGAIPRQRGSQMVSSSISYASSSRPVSTGAIPRQRGSQMVSSSISYASSSRPVHTGAIPRQGDSGFQSTYVSTAANRRQLSFHTTYTSDED